MNWPRVGEYFLTPFPSTKGFSPYRMPGPIFHLAITAAFFVTGLSLCIPANAGVTAPLLAVWVIVGVYVGRDLAIQAHYNALILLPGFIAIIVVLAVPDVLESLHNSLASWSSAHYPEGAAGVTAALAAAFAVWVWHSTRAA